MDRSFYMRFGVVISAIVLAGLALWPSFRVFNEEMGTPPEWLAAAFPNRIQLGLDIQGGLRLMYEVEVDEYISDRRDGHADQMVRELGVLLGVYDDDEVDSLTRDQITEVAEHVTVQRVGGRGININFSSEDDAEVFSNEWLSQTFPDLRRSGGGTQNIELSMREERLTDLREKAVQQAVRTISDRVDAMGIKEATVIGREADIIVEVPGATEEDFNQIRAIIARTAQLEFKVLDDEASFVADIPQETLDAAGLERATELASVGESNPAVPSAYLISRGAPCSRDDAECVSARDRLTSFIETAGVPSDHQLIISRVRGADRVELDEDEEAEEVEEEEVWRTFYVFRSTEVTGEDVDDAFVSYDPQDNGVPSVSIQFDATGAGEFEEMTGRNIKRRMAIVLDDVAESAPVIQDRIGGGRCKITLGGGNPQQVAEEADDLVLVLRAGALPAPLRPANEQLIGPTLGRDSVKQGAIGALVGVTLVLIFMLIYYQAAGAIADVMVVLNLFFLLSLMSAFGATLTLPGVAAIALTVGMAVDANVLITERIREELRQGKSTRSAVEQGFARAFSSVFDSQVTTFIAGVVLFQFGTGPIKGFAVMLMIGIVTSLFTGIFCSKVLFDWVTRGLKVENLKVG